MLPHIKPNRQCIAKAKSTRTRCLNPAAYGCKTCRLHGARKPETIRRGVNHPNHKHGQFTKEAISQYRTKIYEISELEAIGFAKGIFTGQRTRGPKPKKP